MRKLFTLLFLLLFVGNGYCATQLKKTVIPSGGDYTSLEACMNANEQNLVTADKYFDVEIDGDWSGGADTSAVTIHNYTTSVSCHINIYTTSTARHKGIYSTSYYRLEYSNYFGAIFVIANSNVKLEGILIKNTRPETGSESAVMSFLGTNIVISKIIGIAMFRAFDTWNDSSSITLINSILIIKTGTGGFIRNYVSSWYVYNSIYITNYASGYGMDINGIGGTALVKNCYVKVGVGGTCYGSLTKTTCASSDSSGTTGLQNITYSTDNFTNVTEGSEDLHLVAGSYLINVGTDLSTTFTDDIDGDTRSGTWDIGADEYVNPIQTNLIFNNVVLNYVIGN